MRRWFATSTCLLILGCASFLLLSLTYGQDVKFPLAPTAKPPSASTLPPSTPPLPRSNALNSGVAGKTAKPRTSLEIAKLPPLHRQMYLSANSGAAWLHRIHSVNGRFVPGFLPALNTDLEGDHALRQAGAAFALARAARFLREKDQAIRAAQAILTLLEDTTVDSKNPQVRYPLLPAALVNRLSLSAWLVLAIHELPNPGDDLLGKSEQLCHFIRDQQQEDGSLRYLDAGSGEKTAVLDPEGVHHYPGQALYALMRSQQHRPAKWKTEVVRKAFPYYRKWWSEHKNRDFVTWQTAAYTEAFLSTKDREFAQFVHEMNDWLCGLQYDRLDPQHPRWFGGFMDWEKDKPTVTMPTVRCAMCAESLAEACRVTRELGDLQRHERYSATLERCLQFLTTLQYTEGDTQHFQDWYRPRLLGGFHASHQDGHLRIDYNQHAVSALVQYLVHVARLP